MRRLAILLIALALSTPAGAQQPKRLRIVEPPAKPALRPTERPPETVPEAPLPAGGFTPVRSSASDIDRCRQACAKSLYFCLADEEEAMCYGQWSQCSARCN